MEYKQLTSTAKSICEQNYKSNCGGCPLRPECVGQIGPGKESFDRWIDRVNQLADEIENK
ncbi:hypothetical protein [Paenibacillus sp. GCM10027626]|uniref:hypothetical protein n=1 Tax=Paenibacillus sp. GCM10027626 TaxID=3273411 RepID=UPI00363EE741